MPGDCRTEPHIRPELISNAVPSVGTKASLSVWSPLWYIAPLILVLLGLLGQHSEKKSSLSSSANLAEPAPEAGTRLILIVLDSLRPESLDELMPNLRAFAARPESYRVGVTTAGGNMTGPCLKTMLEGREIPLVGRIDSFFTKADAPNSLPSLAAHEGFGVSIVSDVILVSLYGSHAIYAKEIGGGPFLWRDMTTLDEGLQQLQDPRVRVLILHLTGIDRVAHQWHPGHPEYESHHHTVDDKLGQFIKALDLRHDHLVIAGDHGHNLLGSHERRSLAIFAGGGYPALFDSIGRPTHLKQTDVLFFLSFPLLLPLPSTYEGNYFAGEQPAAKSAPSTGAFQEKFARFLSVQKAALTKAHVDPATIFATTSARRTQASRALLSVALSYLPLLVWYVFWLVAGFQDNATPRPFLWWVILAAGWPIFWLASSPKWGWELAVAMGLLAGRWAYRRKQGRALAFVLLIVVLAALPAYFAFAWREVFCGDFGDHRGWPNHFEIPMLVATMGAMGLLLALLRYHSWQAAPEGTGLFCLFCLPSGLFGYQFGANILRGLLVSGLVLVSFLWLGRLLTTRRWPAPTLRLSTAAALVAMGSSWFLILVGQGVYDLQWVLFSLAWMKPIQSWLLPGLYTASSLYLLGATTSRPGRAGLLCLLVFTPWYGLQIAQLPLDALVAAMLPAVLMAAWLRLRDTGWSMRHLSTRRTELTALTLMACILMSFWTAFHGYSLDRTDFSFGFQYLSVNTPESWLYIFLYPATLLKYGLPACLIVVFFMLNVDPRERREVFGLVLLLLHLKILTLVVQSIMSMLGTREKMYELAISELLAVFSLILLTAATYTAVTASSLALEAWRRRSRSEVPAFA